MPNAQPKVWHPSFQSQNGPITVNDFVMMSDITVIVVAVGIINPREKCYWQIGLILKPLTIDWHSPSNVLSLFQILVNVCMLTAEKFEP